MEKIINFIRNKYFLVTVAFTVWMVFFDRNDLPTQFSYQKQKTNLENELDFYIKKNEEIITTLKNIRSNNEEVQRIAREKYKMKKDNEDVYVITKVAPDTEKE